MENPKVTILMSIYNGEKYLREAVNSILAQTFKDFEFLIIDDGSTDLSLDIIKSYTDTRIRLVRNEQNIGLTKSLNKGLGLAHGEYIARMDVDDISLPKRLETQMKVLEATRADICFCRSHFVNEINGRKYIWQEKDWLFIRWRGLFENKYGLHSAVMFRRKSILRIGGYDESFIRAQDYDLWDRCAAYGLNFTYTSTPLLRYYLRSQGTSRWHLTEQEQYACQVSLRAIRRLMSNAEDGELQGLRWLFLKRELALSDESIRSGIKLCFNLVHVFLSKKNKRKDARLIWQDVAISLAFRLRYVGKNFRIFMISLIIQAILRSPSIRSIYRSFMAYHKI